MKLALSFIAVVLTFTINSCKKEHPANNRFYGIWEKRSSSGFNFPFATYPTGNGRYIELNRNGILNKYENGKLIYSTSYKITKRKIEGCNRNGISDYIALEYENDNYDRIDIINDTLTIATPPCWEDGGFSTYIRVNQ